MSEPEQFDGETLGRPVAGFRKRFSEDRWEARDRQVDSARDRMLILRERNGSKKAEPEAEPELVGQP